MFSQLSFGGVRSDVVGLERAGRSNCVIDVCVFQVVLFKGVLFSGCSLGCHGRKAKYPSGATQRTAALFKEQRRRDCARRH